VQDAETAAARIAERQQGMVTTQQLLAAGFGHGGITRRAATGWLVRRHRGVYQVGVFGGPFGDEMAGLLAYGDDAVLSHRTAAALCGLRARTNGEPIDVITPRRARPGVRAHDIELTERDITVRHGMRMTTPARTLLDLASSMPAVELERLIEEAQVRRLLTAEQLLAALDDAPGRRGAKRLRALIEPELGYTRSEAERRLRELVRKAGLPLPRTNVKVAGLEVDALWAEQRLVVEVDGYAYHRTREAFERDRRRDARLLVAGYRVLRISWRRLTREPEQVIALLAAALRG
jgi:very-short-patch-repair endonuclease